MRPSGLRREIGLAGAIAYGVGITIGAGIYALIGLAAGIAGNALWISFGLAAAIASFTGLSYAKMSSLFPSSGAEFVYVKKSLNNSFLAFMVGWLVIISGIVSIATVSLAFGGYAKSYIGVSEIMIAAALVSLLSIVNYLGIKESVRVYFIMTSIQIFGIVLIIILGAPSWGKVDYFYSPAGIEGVSSSIAIVFFAFLGFEGLAKIGDETKNPSVTLPRALFVTLALSTLLYILLSISIVSVLPFDELARSSSPLVDVALMVQGQEAASLISFIALLSTSNGVLIILISMSRVVYGMARESSLPSALAKVHPKRGTPQMAIFFVTISAILFTLIGDLKIVVGVANSTIFLVFFAVNSSLIALIWKQAKKGNGVFKKVMLPLLGASSSLILLAQFDVITILSVTSLMIVGVIIYLIMVRRTGNRGDVESIVQ